MENEPKINQWIREDILEESSTTKKQPAPAAKKPAKQEKIDE